MSKAVGRPSVVTAEVVSVLSARFSDGCNVTEACMLSGISREAYYYRLRNNAQFADIMKSAQMNPAMNARRVVISAIDAGDLSAAKWWLERKLPSEFGISSRFNKKSTQKVNQFKGYNEDEIMALRKQIADSFEQ